MVAVDGLLDPEAGQTVLSALEPLARPTSAAEDRSASQRRADARRRLACDGDLTRVLVTRHGHDPGLV